MILLHSARRLWCPARTLRPLPAHRRRMLTWRASCSCCLAGGWVHEAYCFVCVFSWQSPGRGNHQALWSGMVMRHGGPVWWLGVVIGGIGDMRSGAVFAVSDHHFTRFCHRKIQCHHFCTAGCVRTSPRTRPPRPASSPRSWRWWWTRAATCACGCLTSRAPLSRCGGGDT